MRWLLALLLGLGAAGPDASPPAEERAPPATALPAERREDNPRSEKVKLKLWAQPVPAEVFWGAVRLGTAGRDPLEIERPRGSGPLDVVVRAPGYLPFHTRLLTDRDDSVTVRLLTPTAARGLLGWKPTLPAAVEKRP